MSCILADEFATAAAAATPADYDGLVGQGVRRTFLYEGACRFGVAEIDTATDDLYQPASGGRLAYIMPALPLPAPWDAGFPDDDPADLIAWLPGNPRRWWRRCHRRGNG